MIIYIAKFLAVCRKGVKNPKAEFDRAWPRLVIVGVGKCRDGEKKGNKMQSLEKRQLGMQQKESIWKKMS